MIIGVTRSFVGVSVSCSLSIKMPLVVELAGGIEILLTVGIEHGIGVVSIPKS